MAQEGLGQGPETSGREISLNAVRDDANMLADLLVGINETLDKLGDHLNGNAQPDAAKPVIGVEAAVHGALPGLCDRGSRNVVAARTIQERLNELCCQLGEGR